jgi:two-component system, sensor histidine kinase and response regulator
MKTILIVDDDDALRATFALVLRRKGYRVIEANSGTTGLETARQYLPDLILSDIHMPGGDGTNLLHTLRIDPELRSRQIVLMTGKPELVTPRKGMEDGADDFLVKPINMESLLNCIEARFRRASVSWRVEDHMLAQLRSSVPPNLPHEFFTPMAGIIGLMEIVRDGAATLTPAAVAEIHNDIYLSALRLNRILRNYLLILDLQAMAPEVRPPVLSPLQTKQVVEAGVNEALRQNQRPKDFTVRIEACPLSVKPDDFSRIVEELVDNACKFSRHGTPVTVTLENEGRLIVTDEGRGMTPEEISRIGAFQQFDREKYAQQGLGLGLVLVQKLSAVYRAKFSLQSDPGKGTRVEVAFPPPAGP